LRLNHLTIARSEMEDEQLGMLLAGTPQRQCLLNNSSPELRSLRFLQKAAPRQRL